MPIDPLTRDALAFIRAVHDDPDGAVSMLNTISPHELRRITIRLAVLHGTARSIRPELPVTDWCDLISRQGLD